MAQKILKDNEDLLHSISAVLIERERVDGAEFDKLFAGEVLPPLVIPEPVVEEEPDDTDASKAEAAADSKPEDKDKAEVTADSKPQDTDADKPNKEAKDTKS